MSFQSLPHRRSGRALSAANEPKGCPARRVLAVLVSLLPTLFVTPAAWSDDMPRGEERFRKTIAPLFSRRCVSCHNPKEREGGLSLATGADFRKGGDSGAIVVADHVDDSELLRALTPTNGKARMPKQADPLRPEELRLIRAWLQEGAPWPNDLTLGAATAPNAEWWSLRPIVRPALPPLPPEKRHWVREPIDAFIAAKHLEHSLQPAPEADRRTLIRRLAFDLIGLPPSFEQVETFVASRDPLAYEKLVDELLASPHYGERWARHWLDVVHFGETHGYDKDKPRSNAWPYRDYVIRAFNTDKPYSQFVREQIAGDVVAPATVDGYEALGFLSAGPWDFIGHAEVPETKIDGKVARHLDRDDFVSNTIGTFCSLTVHCAQCHNHKFDPISQDDYYRLQAVFAAIDRTDRPYDRDPTVAERRATLQARQSTLASQQRKLEQAFDRQPIPELKSLDAEIAKLVAEVEKAPAGTPPPEHGYHSQVATKPDTVKWVQLDLGAPRAIRDVLLIGAYDNYNNIGAGFGYPVRFRIDVCDRPDFTAEVRTLADRTERDEPNPGVVPQRFPAKEITARYVRITATQLAVRKNDYILALAELEVRGPGNENWSAMASVTALDSIEAPIRWGKKNLVDGKFHRPSGAATELAALRQKRADVIRDKADPALSRDLQAVATEQRQITQALAQLPPPSRVYSGAIHTGTGSFAGTGANGGKPRPIFLLKRGNILQPAHEVAPGAIAAIPGPREAFARLSPQHPEAERRRALAEWITDRAHPLTWRSVVNRVWMYHFGRGLVDTPNDFGRMGELPTHPELLDWLAAEFRDGGRHARAESLKDLHRMIVRSATYRQASQSGLSQPAQQADPATSTAATPANLDPENRWLSRANRRKLEAEAVRDAMLLVTGQLDRQPGGPSFQDFVIEKPEHSPHYQYHLHDARDPKTHRRSIYRFLVRSQPQPFMSALDCADPSLMVDKRTQTLTPLQALALLNNSLTVALSDLGAQRIASQSDVPREQVRLAVRSVLSRNPTVVEQAAFEAHAARHGVANLLRVLMNLNEFVFVD